MATLKLLPSDVRSAVRSGIAINSVSQCVEELVYNSLDAGAKTIHVGVNFDQFNVRVDDDGNGLTEADMELAGTRYCTSKCNSLADLNNLTQYGFRGEALASIVDVSNIVDIISRPKSTMGIELKKKFMDGQRKGFIEKQNATKMQSGTSIVVGKLLSKVPVRQQRIDKSIQIEEVKAALEKIVLINPAVNLELRNEQNGTVLFSFTSAASYSDAINQVFMRRIGFEVKFIYENHLHSKFFFNFSVCKDFVKKKHYQFVYVNNRYIRRCKIHKCVGQLILEQNKDLNAKNPDKYPVFMLTITCPFNEYDIMLEPKKQKVEFRNWDELFDGIEGLMLKLRRKDRFSVSSSNNDSLNKSTSFINSYDVKSALHSRFVAKNLNTSSAAASSCSGSEQGSKDSWGKNVTGKIKPHNSFRSSPNKRLLNVREIRRKRKLAKKEPEKPIQIPHRPSLSPAITKPRLTLGLLKKFPVWAEELNSQPAPSKKPRISDKNDVNDNDLYLNKKKTIGADSSTYQERCGVMSDPQNLQPPIPSIFKQNSPNETHNAVYMEHTNTDLDLSWKLRRFFEAADQQSVDVMKTPGDKILNDPDADTDFQVVGVGKKIVYPETPWPEDFDMHEFVFSKSKEIISEHFAYTCSLNDVQKDIAKKFTESYKVLLKKLTPVQETTKTPTPAPCTVQSETSLTVNSRVSNGSDVNARKAGSYSCVSSTTSHQSNACNKPPSDFLSHHDVVQSQIQSRSSPGNAASRSHKIQSTTGFQMSITNSFHVPDANENLSKIFSQSALLKPSSTFGVDRSTSQAISSSSKLVLAPPLLNLFPIQKPFLNDWNDCMLRENYSDPDDTMFPSDFSGEIVQDDTGQEWLQMYDENSIRMFINLNTGETSYNTIPVFGSMLKVSAGDMNQRLRHKPNWLRRYFPRGFHQFWNGDKREVNKNGDLNRLKESKIGDSLMQCISRQSEDESMCKWTADDFQNVSKYFEDTNFQKKLALDINSTTGGAGVQCWKDCSGTTQSIRIARADFEHVKVIGQLDRKFIITAIRASVTEAYTLVIFDQHAVHERIRLENLIKEAYVNWNASEKQLKESDLMPPITLVLSETGVRIMERYNSFFRHAALKYVIISTTCVKVQTAPMCFMEKVMNEPAGSREKAIRTLILSLLQELIEKIVDTKVATLHGLPKTINNVLCSQACHGAIKFGEALDAATCEQLIQDLRKCKNLFQCAHGRPSVVPIIKGLDVNKLSRRDVALHSTEPAVPFSSCAPLHLDCSSYFCNGRNETSFSFLDFLDSNADSDIRSVQSNSENPEMDHLNSRLGNNIFGESFSKPEFKGSNHMFQFLCEPMNIGKDDDLENSPYFSF